MIENLTPKERKNDVKILAWIIAGFIFVVWLCTPPGNKFMQICFWGNNTQFFIAKIRNNDETTAYKFYRNNAIYLVRMDMKKQALTEIDKAINTFPAYMSDNILESLYRDRAQIKMFYHDYKGALNDYLRIKNLEFTDYFKLAMLYKVNGKYKFAAQNCNKILSLDSSAYAGYLCLADVYAEVGRADASVNILSLLIDKHPNRAKYYSDRANYKLLAGDKAGHDADMAKAKELNPHLDFESSLIEETLNPKVLTLTIK